MRLKELVCGELWDLLEKVRTGERLGRRDFLRLWDTQDLTGLGAVANFARERASGNFTVYRYQVHLDCTGRQIGLSSEGNGQRLVSDSAPMVPVFGPAAAGGRNPVGELRISGGLTSEQGAEDLCDLVRRVRTLYPQLHLRAFSWSELYAAAERENREPAAVLSALVEAGINSLAGGELGYLGPEGWGDGLDAVRVMERYVPWVRASAAVGLKSEFAWLTVNDGSPETLADFLLCVRELQDRWTIFEACTPLPVQPRLGGVETQSLTGFNQLRAVVAARLFLDNIPRIQSPIAAVGESVALAAQWYGADDVGGVSFPDGSEGSARVAELIRTAGREPVHPYAGAR